MIIEKLKSIEKDATMNIEYEKGRLESTKNFLEHLNQIDFEFEEIRIDNKQNLKKLMTSLKGNNLNKNENKLLTEITK